MRFFVRRDRGVVEKKLLHEESLGGGRGAIPWGGGGRPFVVCEKTPSGAFLWVGWVVPPPAGAVPVSFRGTSEAVYRSPL